MGFSILGWGFWILDLAKRDANLWFSESYSTFRRFPGQLGSQIQKFLRKSKIPLSDFPNPKS
jgi:hypothetical protein